jgi:hypothetical protein
MRPSYHIRSFFVGALQRPEVYAEFVQQGAVLAGVGDEYVYGLGHEWCRLAVMGRKGREFLETMFRGTLFRDSSGT